jgi:hypothetical protein
LRLVFLCFFRSLNGRSKGMVSSSAKKPLLAPKSSVMVLEVRADDFDGLKLPEAKLATGLRCPGFSGLGHCDAGSSSAGPGGANGGGTSSSESDHRGARAGSVFNQF